MKKFNKNIKKKIPIKELAEQFSHELDSKLPVHVMPNGDMVYKNYLVRKMKNDNWGVFNIQNKDLVDQFFLKTCALMAAKAYNNTRVERFFEIKRLDNRYWANHCDLAIYKKNIKTAKDFDRYMVLLNKLEDSEAKVKYYKDEISRMFAWSFV
jgi:hypothetical protein